MQPAPPFAAWGLPERELLPLPGGHRNLVLTDGEHVFKTTRRSAAALRWLSPVQDRAESAGIVVPRYLPTLEGGLSANGWTAEPRLSGHAPDAEELADLARRAEALRHGPALPQRPGFASATELARGAASDEADLAAIPEPLASKLGEALMRLADHEEAPVHGDICASNVLILEDNRPALLDWDEARRDADLFDIVATGAKLTLPQRRALLAHEIAVCWRVEPERAGWLAEGFLASG